MSIFSKLRKNKQIVYSPISGKSVELETVNDYVFQNKMAGDGLAVIPDSNTIYAPIDGEIKVVFPTKHVIGIENKNGVGIIVHVGIDTVELNGNGFEPLIKVGDKVSAGDPILNFDLKRLNEQYDMTVMICVDESEKYDFEYRKIGAVSAKDELFIIKEK